MEVLEVDIKREVRSFSLPPPQYLNPDQVSVIETSTR